MDCMTSHYVSNRKNGERNVRQTNGCASADGHEPTQSIAAKGYMIKLYEYIETDGICFSPCSLCVRQAVFLFFSSSAASAVFFYPAVVPSFAPPISILYAARNRFSSFWSLSTLFLDSRFISFSLVFAASLLLLDMNRMCLCAVIQLRSLSSYHPFFATVVCVCVFIPFEKIVDSHFVPSLVGCRRHRHCRQQEEPLPPAFSTYSAPINDLYRSTYNYI